MIGLQLFGGIVALCAVVGAVAYVGFTLYWRLNPSPKGRATQPLTEHESALFDQQLERLRREPVCCAPRRDAQLTTALPQSWEFGFERAGAVPTVALSVPPEWITPGTEQPRWQPAEYEQVIQLVEPAPGAPYWDISGLAEKRRQASPNDPVESEQQAADFCDVAPANNGE